MDSDLKGTLEIMTVGEVASYLKISEVTTYKLVQSGAIQGFRIGRSWRIRMEDLLLFIESRKERRQD